MMAYPESLTLMLIMLFLFKYISEAMRQIIKSECRNERWHREALEYMEKLKLEQQERLMDDPNEH
jgi:hypothetical protein